MNKVKEFLHKIDITEIIYLLVFTFCLVYFFLCTTMFWIEWPSYMEEKIVAVLFFADILRLAYLKNTTWKEALFMAALLAGCYYAWKINGYIDPMYFALITIGMKDISADRILKIFFLVNTIMLIITVCCALNGKIENLVYIDQVWEHERARYALGICYPTDFSAHVLYILLAYGFIRRNSMKIIDLIIIAACGGVTYYYTDGRTSLCILILFIVMLVIGMINKKHPVKPLIIKIYKWLCIAISAFCFVFMLAASYFYNSGNALISKIDKLLTFRLYLSNVAFKDYPVTKWGQYIFMQGAGASVEEQENYFYIDSSYVSILLRFGIFVTALIILALIILFIRSYRNDYLLMLSIMMLVAVQCAIEHHIIEVTYNIFIFLVFADFTGKRSEFWGKCLCRKSK